MLNSQEMISFTPFYPFCICTVLAFYVVTMYNYHPWRLAKSNILKQYFSHVVNDVSDGSPSRIRRVLRISFGMTILPKSSTRRTMPVAFISFPLLVVNSSGSVCRFWGIMREPVFKVKWQGIPRLRHFNPRSPRGERLSRFALRLSTIS